MKDKKKTKSAADVDGDIAATYNAFKEFEGQRYTGMKVGRSHRWQYDPGDWKETKLTPDQWGIHYAVKKRRAGKAPEGSGVPVGTSYHWYILAHQNVTKLNANDYSTSMTGMKFKLAHKRASADKWSASEQAQRKHLIKILQAMVQDLEKQVAAETKTRAVTKPRRRVATTKRQPPSAARSAANGRYRQTV